MRIIFLGTGTSHGVPPLDCMISGFRNCPNDVCRKSRHDPKHRRSRSSLLVEFAGHTVLIDVSADFRTQMMREVVTSIDAVLITHGHADHINGIPDIRSYTRNREDKLPFYGTAESMDRIRSTYSYIFDPSTYRGGGIPDIALHPVESTLQLFGRQITLLPVAHGGTSGCAGYRIGPMAYIPDMKHMDDATLNLCKGVDVLILNTLRITGNPSTHLTLPESMELASRIAPGQCFFVHMDHSVDYERHTALLQPWMAFGYDGLRLEC